MRKPNNPKLPMLAFLCALCMCSCMSATGPNGEKLAMVMTNTGFTTDKITESKSRSNPIPLIGGGYNNDDLTTAKEAQQLTRITVGAISVEGVIDQGTPIDASLGWAYRITRAIVTGQVFKVGIKEYSAVSQAKTAADVSKHGATTSAGVTKALSKNRLDAVKAVGVPGEVPIQAIQSP